MITKELTRCDVKSPKELREMVKLPTCYKVVHCDEIAVQCPMCGRVYGNQHGWFGYRLGCDECKIKWTIESIGYSVPILFLKIVGNEKNKTK